MGDPAKPNPLAIISNREPKRRVEVELPDYLPARMLNEFVYCPRLFFYEWVEGSSHTAPTPSKGSCVTRSSRPNRTRSRRLIMRRKSTRAQSRSAARLIG
jgi:hypothetical protein